MHFLQYYQFFRDLYICALIRPLLFLALGCVVTITKALNFIRTLCTHGQEYYYDDKKKLLLALHCFLQYIMKFRKLVHCLLQEYTNNSMYVSHFCTFNVQEENQNLASRLSITNFCKV